jgi:hypothetical protein
MRIRKLLIAATAVALGAVGLGTAPAHAVAKMTWPPGGVDVAGCLSSVGAQTFEGIYMAIGAEAGTDVTPCTVPNSDVRVVAELYLLPLNNGASTVKVMEAVGHCNQTNYCQRTQGFASGIMPPGIYKLIGTITVDPAGTAPPVTHTINGGNFLYLLTDLQNSPI